MREGFNTSTSTNSDDVDNQFRKIRPQFSGWTVRSHDFSTSKSAEKPRGDTFLHAHTTCSRVVFAHWPSSMELAPTHTVLEFEHSDFSDDEETKMKDGGGGATDMLGACAANAQIKKDGCEAMDMLGACAFNAQTKKDGGEATDMLGACDFSDDEDSASSGRLATPPESRSDASPPTRCRSWIALCCKCRCYNTSTAMSVFLLVFNVQVLSIYFVMHCTPVLDRFYPGTQEWVGITSSIKIIAGILLGLGLGVSLNVLAKVRRRFTWTHTRRGGAGGCTAVCDVSVRSIALVCACLLTRLQLYEACTVMRRRGGAGDGWFVRRGKDDARRGVDVGAQRVGVVESGCKGLMAHDDSAHGPRVAFDGRHWR